MSLLTVGLNHTTAPVAVREQINFGADSLSDALQDIQHQCRTNEALIFSTCNRTEIYCVSDNQKTNEFYSWLHRYHGLETGLLAPYLYAYPGVDAISHLLRVAGGLDSMIIGEPQVLGQLKRAYHSAVNAGTVGRLLGRLFQHSFRVAKEIRSKTEIGNNSVSVSFAAVRLAQQIFGELENCVALLIGAGETIERVAYYLHKSGVSRIIVANRTAIHARRLASQFHGYAVSLSDLAEYLSEADLVLSSTASNEPILGQAVVEAALKKRKHKPMFFVDLAVPRDIDPATSQLRDVYLYTVDDLEGIVGNNKLLRQQAACQAEMIIDTQTAYFINWMRAQESIKTICLLREQAEQFRQQVLQDGYKKLKRGVTPEQVLNEATRSLAKKLTHMPSTKLRQVEPESQTMLLEVVQDLFGLDKSATTVDKATLKDKLKDS